jgi:hypothetical protein
MADPVVGIVAGNHRQPEQHADGANVESSCRRQRADGEE